MFIEKVRMMQARSGTLVELGEVLLGLGEEVLGLGEEVLGLGKEVLGLGKEMLGLGKEMLGLGKVRRPAVTGYRTACEGGEEGLSCVGFLRQAS